MTVWAGTGAASVYSGEVFVRLAFIRFMKTGEADYWQEDCAEHEIAGTAAFESQSIKLKKGIESASAVPGDALRSTRRGEEAKEKGFSFDPFCRKRRGCRDLWDFWDCRDG